MNADQVDKAEVERVEPVFFLNNEVDQEDGKYLNTLEVCLAVCNVVSDENVVEGAQRIGGLWRVYLTDRRARWICFALESISEGFRSLSRIGTPF